MTKVFELYNKRYRKIFLTILGLSAANSILSSMLLIFINDTIIRKPIPYLEGYNWQVFVVLLIVSFGFGRLFQVRMIKFTTNTLSEFQMSLLERIRHASYEAFEKLGPERVYTAMGDVQVLGQIPQTFISFVNSFVLAVCGLGYMFWVSWMGGTLILLGMSGLFIFYLLKNRSLEKRLNELRDLQNDYHRYLKDFLKGFREIKMSSTRNDKLYNNYIKKNIEQGRELNISTSIKYQGNELIGYYSWYVLFGLALFALPAVTGLSMTSVIGFVVILLFLSGPVNTLIGVIPFYTRAKIASERLANLEKEVAKSMNNDDMATAMNGEKFIFQSLRLDGVEYEYNRSSEEEPFRVGPIDVEILRGEVVFITGGNGSGKSTFINLISGLYGNKSGKMELNGKVISSQQYRGLRNHLAVIFTNPHLFNENYEGMDITLSNQELIGFIQLMQLEDKLQIDEQRKWMDINLSQGQQKRLSLILALMEKKEIIILDEWAAEQDPSFKRYFYHRLIPYLKNMGKTVIAVTHDDAYFKCADRLINFNLGQIVSDRRNSLLAAKDA